MVHITDASMQEFEKEHIAKVREVAPECAVLLKSNGDFPLEAAGKIALFGSGARRTIRGRNRIRGCQCQSLYDRRAGIGECWL